MPNHDELLQDLARLRVENASLRALLRANGIALPDAAPRLGAPAAAICEVDTAAPCAEQMNAESAVMPVTKASSLSEKIALFRSLFQGRTDVYARHWQGKNGRSS